MSIRKIEIIFFFHFEIISRAFFFKVDDIVFLKLSYNMKNNVQVFEKKLLNITKYIFYNLPYNSEIIYGSA